MRAIRERAGLRQVDVAAAMHVTQSAVSLWELGARAPRAKKAQELARLLGCSAADIGAAVENERRRRATAKK